MRRGRKEADAGAAPGSGRSRQAGRGRKRAESHDGELAAAFDLLIDLATRGDPMSPLRWTSKSIRALTAGLRGSGHRVSDFVFRRPLAEGGYSLQANAKSTEGGQHLDRDAQLAFLAAQAQGHMAVVHGILRRRFTGQTTPNNSSIHSVWFNRCPITATGVSCSRFVTVGADLDIFGRVATRPLDLLKTTWHSGHRPSQGQRLAAARIVVSHRPASRSAQKAPGGGIGFRR